MTYFDPFAGAGLYEDPNNAEEIQYVKDGQCICPFKNEKYGSPLVALYALYQHITEQKVYGTKKVLLVFAEKDGSNFQHLIKHVKNFISERGRYRICIETKTNVFIQFSLNKITIDIKFFHCSFKDFDDNLLTSNQPMVSFFDPFGYSHTPMGKVKKCAGIRRTIILNLMVNSMNRFVNTKRNQKKF